MSLSYIFGKLFRQSDFMRRQLEVYRSYHRNAVNIITHIVGIPDIMLSLFVFAVAGIASSVWPLVVLGICLALPLAGLMAYQLLFGGWRGVGAAFFGVGLFALAVSGLAAQYFGAWLVLEGFLLGAILMMGILVGEGVNRWAAFRLGLFLMFSTAVITMLVGVEGLLSLSAHPWIAGVALLGMGFVYHLPGHAYFEGNKPALKDDIPSALFGAPQELADIFARPLLWLFRRSS